MLEVIAYDKANNSKKVKTNFSILWLDAPTISFVTPEMKAGDAMYVKGETHPNATVLVTLRASKEILEGRTISDMNGNINFYQTVNNPGNYEVYAKLEDYDGGESQNSKIGILKVKYSLTFLSHAVQTQNPLSVILTLLLMLITSVITYVVTRAALRQETVSPKGLVQNFYSKIRGGDRN